MGSWKGDSSTPAKKQSGRGKSQKHPISACQLLILESALAFIHAGFQSITGPIQTGRFMQLLANLNFHFISHACLWRAAGNHRSCEKLGKRTRRVKSWLFSLNIWQIRCNKFREGRFNPVPSTQTHPQAERPVHVQCFLFCFVFLL